MPWRPANITGTKDILHVVNQLVRETNQRIDDTNKTIPPKIFSVGRLDFGTIAANSSVERTVTTLGATAGGVPHVAPKTYIGDPNVIWSAYISSTHQVTIRLLNPTATPVIPSVVAWNVSVAQ